MSAHQPIRLDSGVVLQSSIPKGMAPTSSHPNGLLLRAVVLATYVSDDPDHPFAGMVASGDKGVGVYCDVLVYSSVPGMRFMPLQAVLVLQPRGGLHNGKIWKPRATKLDITGASVDWQTGKTNPMNLDGDHVLVGFLDDSFNSPVILGGVPHPKMDAGDTTAKKVLKLTLADGDPDFVRHHGIVYGVGDDGNFLIDTTTANDGTTDSSGVEPAAPTDGKGTINLMLPQNATVTISIDGGATIVVEKKDGDTKLTLGNGAVKVAIADHLKTLYGNLKSYIENAMVPTGMGPSGTISAGSGPAPSWDSKIESTHLLIPDE